MVARRVVCYFKTCIRNRRLTCSELGWILWVTWENLYVFWFEEPPSSFRLTAAKYRTNQQTVTSGRSTQSGHTMITFRVKRYKLHASSTLQPQIQQSFYGRSRLTSLYPNRGEGFYRIYRRRKPANGKCNLYWYGTGKVSLVGVMLFFKQKLGGSMNKYLNLEALNFIVDFKHWWPAFSLRRYADEGILWWWTWWWSP